MGIFLGGPQTPYKMVSATLPCFFCLACSLSRRSHVKFYLSFTSECFCLCEPFPDLYTGAYPFPLLTQLVAYASGMVPPFSYNFKEYLDCKENTSQEHTALCKDQKKEVSRLHGFSPEPWLWTQVLSSSPCLPPVGAETLSPFTKRTQDGNSKQPGDIVRVKVCQ